MDITNADQVNTILSFSYTHKDSEVYLYYGNKKELPAPLERKEEYSNLTPTASLLDEEHPNLLIEIQKMWNLKEKGSTILVQITDSMITEGSSYFYLLDDQKTPINLEVQNGFANIDLSNIEAGPHQIFVIRKLNDKITRSNSSLFIATEPIYLSWTIDWEGIDPGKQNLETVSSMADEFKIPLTHFFSPRTLINLKVSDLRKKEIVNWLKNRITNKGDDLSMLLHFQFDLVEEAGVDAKFNEKGWDNGLTGYDIPGTVYNYDEYYKILTWSKEKILEYGLPEPKGFRAGGWFINEENLRAVKDAGFLYDSSSIKPIELGENKLIQDWKINSSTQPYNLSSKDKNSKDTPLLNLYEIPINGGDSYINSDEEIRNNFTDNYSSNSYSNTSKLIVYSSSPEWIEDGKESLENLFATVSNYRYDIDRGPIKFVTLGDWYSTNVK